MTDRKDGKVIGRNSGLDVLRCSLVMSVFLMHSSMHLGCRYGVLTPFVSVIGAVAMTAFFMLSGYSLHINYEGKNLLDLHELKVFFVKRFAGIFPLYYIASVIYAILYGKGSFIDSAVFFPIEFLGMQSWFCSFWGVSHTSGTWFVSCLLFCYMFFPYISNVVKQFNVKSTILIGGGIMLICLFSPFAQHRFHAASNYINPLFRLLEFCLGVILAKVNEFDNKDSLVLRVVRNKIVFLLSLLVLYCGVTYMALVDVSEYMIYSMVSVPCFIVIILNITKISIGSSWLKKLLHKFSDISYSFFLSQLFVWKICKFIIGNIGFNGNASRIVLSFLLCVIISIIMHYLIENPIKKIIYKRI